MASTNPNPLTSAMSDTPHTTLQLDNVRQILLRLEETLIFAFIERAQFAQNTIVYRTGAFPDLTADASLCRFLLHQTEKIHALMRRYTSPDEHPFFEDLPTPRLAALSYRNNPLVPNAININARILADYASIIVPCLCVPGDDRQYGSSVVCDVQALQAISRRVHYGKFVAESKYRQSPGRFNPLIRSGDSKALHAAITHPDVEQAVIERVRNKSATYLGSLRRQGATQIPDAETLSGIYRDWIIPLNKSVQVQYLMQRLQAEHKEL